MERKRHLLLPYRLCAIDMDDTLLGSNHQISERNKRAIEAVRKLGVKVLIASGRMYATTENLAKLLDLDTPIISYNGAMVKDPRTEEVWLEERVEENLAGQILDYCEEYNLQLNFYYQDLLYTAAYTEWLDLYHTRTSAPYKIMPDFYKAMRGILPTKLIIVDDPKTIDNLLPFFRERFGSSLYVTKSNKEYLEFLPPAANKGTALKLVADRYGITSAETIAFGDSWNDIPMLEWAGLSIAVANAKPEVIAIANKVTLSNDEDGVAAALEEIFELGSRG